MNERMQQPDWLSVPGRLDIAADVVDVWRIFLGPGKPRTGLHAATGQRDEARRAMRHILARYLDCAADSLGIATTAAGKPYLQDPHPGLRFNLSHTRGMALLAVALATEVGIDIEVDRPVENRLKLARRVFREEQHIMLKRLPQELQSRRFLQLWTAMEARQKCAGRGIFDSPADEEQLQLFGFVPAPGWLAHVAIGRNGTPPGFRHFDWAWAQDPDGRGNEATSGSG